jgi:hypothetical protein
MNESEVAEFTRVTSRLLTVLSELNEVCQDVYFMRSEVEPLKLRMQEYEHALALNASKFAECQIHTISESGIDASQIKD